MTPRSEAIAFKIWAHCQPLGWNLTNAELADALDLPSARVRAVCQSKGWTTRLRSSAENRSGADWSNPGLARGDLSARIEMRAEE